MYHILHTWIVSLRSNSCDLEETVLSLPVHWVRLQNAQPRFTTQPGGGPEHNA